MDDSYERDPHIMLLLLVSRSRGHAAVQLVY